MRSAIGDVGAVVTGLTLGASSGRRPPPPLLNKSNSTLSITATKGSSSSSLLQTPVGGGSPVVSGEAYPLVMDTKLKIIEILQVSFHLGKKWISNQCFYFHLNINSTLNNTKNS